MGAQDNGRYQNDSIQGAQALSIYVKHCHFVIKTIKTQATFAQLSFF